MRKIISILIIGLLIFSNLFILTGCDTEKEPKNFNKINVINEEEIMKSNDRINFTDNLCLAIGYSSSENTDRFIEKYFNSEEEYLSLDSCNMTSRNTTFRQKFVIIPKNENVKVSIWTCMMNSDFEFEKDQIALKDHTGPFILYTNDIEYTPEIMIEFKYNGYEAMFPIMFSGDDGRLVLSGNESEVLDISIY